MIGALSDTPLSAPQVSRCGGYVTVARGVELNVTRLEGWTLALRAGAWRVGGAGDERPRPLVTGLMLDRVTVDYTFQGMRGPGNAHWVSVQFRQSGARQRRAAGRAPTRAGAAHSSRGPIEAPLHHARCRGDSVGPQAMFLSDRRSQGCHASAPG
jgi:hypothetical protein